MTNRVDAIGAGKLGRKGDKIGNVERDFKKKLYVLHRKRKMGNSLNLLMQ